MQISQTIAFQLYKMTIF